MYQLIYVDPDCEQLDPSSKVAIRTYTTDKINIVGSCSLFAVHEDTSNLKQVTFQVPRHEGSVVLSCTITLELALIQSHSNLKNCIPSSASLISSNADYPKKGSQKNILITKPNTNVCSCKEQTHFCQNQTSTMLISV